MLPTYQRKHGMDIYRIVQQTIPAYFTIYKVFTKGSGRLGFEEVSISAGNNGIKALRIL